MWGHRVCWWSDCLPLLSHTPPVSVLHGHASPLRPGARLHPFCWSGCMFLFYLLGVGLPCRSIFCQFWLCEEAQCVYLRRHLGSLITHILNCASDGLAISSSLSCTFSGALISFFIWTFFFFLSWCACYKVMGGALGIPQGGATHFAVLCSCLWGRGPRGNNAACSALSLLSVTFPDSQRQIGPFGC